MKRKKYKGKEEERKEAEKDLASKFKLLLMAMKKGRLSTVVNKQRIKLGKLVENKILSAFKEQYKDGLFIVTDKKISLMMYMREGNTPATAYPKPIYQQHIDSTLKKKSGSKEIEVMPCLFTTFEEADDYVQNNDLQGKDKGSNKVMRTPLILKVNLTFGGIDKIVEAEANNDKSVSLSLEKEQKSDRRGMTKHLQKPEIEIMPPSNCSNESLEELCKEKFNKPESKEKREAGKNFRPFF